MKLNLGSGAMRFPGFLNVDHRKEAKPDILDDVFKLSSIENESVTELVSSHILEHACFDRAEEVLKRWWEVLTEGGEIWIAVPDFERTLSVHWAAYKKGDISWEYFNSRIFGNAASAKGMYGSDELDEIPGIFKYEMAFHRAVFTAKVLKGKMEKVGLVQVERLPKLPIKFKHADEMCFHGVRE